MKNIDNSYRFQSCPFCNTTATDKTGNLRYAGATEFSTFSVNLLEVPEIWQCTACHSSFTQNTIPPQEAERLYATGEGSKRWSPKNFEEDKTNEVIACLDKLVLKKGLKLLDIGCNTGEFLDYAKAKGMDTSGLEICEESCRILKDKNHHAFRFSKEIQEKFDVVTAFDVVEHLYEPVSFFSFVRTLLNDSGWLVVLTGNPRSFTAKFCKNQWWYFNYPEHVVFPSPQFFQHIQGFQMKEHKAVYASKAHEPKSAMRKILELIRENIYSRYTGLSAFSADHQLVFLQKQ